MLQVRIVHTSSVTPGELRAIRDLLDAAFDGEFGDDDFEHALGGVHAIVHEDGALLGHGAVVVRRLLHGGTALRTGYVEGVAVRADRRRRGIGGMVMDELERVIAGGYALGALSASDDGQRFYAGRGWRRWAGPTSVITPRGIERTPDDDGGVHVLPVTATLDLDGEIACEWRGGDVW